MGTDTKDSSRIGSTIDSRYKLIELLGEGAMGSVYRAKHVGIGRFVAVKLLHPDVGKQPDIAARFEREALATGRVDHPNCVMASDFGHLEDGTCYFVMELLEGRSLAEVLANEERLSVSRSLHIVRHLLRGLAHAHRAGVVHRDLKPENVIIVDHEGDADFAKILDFGLAKLLGEGDTNTGGKPLTQAGMAFGTPVYMSPEQAYGKPIDGRTDLYAVSIMLYEMIAGRPPFEGDDPIDILPMHVTCEVPRLVDVAPEVDVPAAVEAVIRRGLEKRPADRFQSAKEFLAAINDLHALDWMVEQTPRPDVGRTASVPAGQALARAQFGTTSSAQPPIPRPTVPAIYVSAAPSIRPSPPAVGQATVAIPPRIQAPPKRRRVGLLLVIIGLLVAVGALLVVLLISRQPERPEGMDVGREAAAMLEDGNAEAAIAILEARREIIEANPKAQLLLGNAYAAVKKHESALGAYRKSLALDPKLATDGTLRSNVTAMLAHRQGKVASIALRTLETIIEATGDDAAKQELVEAASSHKRISTRQAAVTLAEKLGLGDRIDRLTSYTLDLMASGPCKRRRQSVAKLRRLGDKRAIPALRKSRGRWRKKKNTNACLRRHAEAAIKHLESLP